MKQIKITALTVYVTDIPVRLMRRHGSGDVAGSVKNAILKLETDAGITGWGDAAPWAVFTGTIEANVAALHVYLRPVLIGADPFRIEALMEAADHAVVGHPEAKAAMEMALFDIVGQASGLPVAVGFGIRTPEVAADIARVADAVVVGSALVDEVAKAVEMNEDVTARVLSKANSLSKAVRSARVGQTTV